MKTDTTEKELESLIMRHMTGTDGPASGVESSTCCDMGSSTGR